MSIITNCSSNWLDKRDKADLGKCWQRQNLDWDVHVSQAGSREECGGGDGWVAQSRPTLCSPMDCSPPGSTVHGISQARIPDWDAISFSRGPSWPRDWTHISCMAGGFFATEPPGKPLERTTGVHYIMLSPFLCIWKLSYKITWWWGWGGR